MSFDEVQFPLKAAYGSSGGPQFSTDIVTIAGGFERRNQNWSQARRVFDARSGVRSAEDAMILLAFFQARAGRARGFRLKDWMDYSSARDGVSAPTATDQTLGQGDGNTLTFALVKTYGSGSATYQRGISKPVANSVSVAIDGVTLASGWAVDSTRGIVTFASAPILGSKITAGFLFDVPVRFDCDKLSFESYDRTQKSASIPLIEVRIA